MTIDTSDAILERMMALHPKIIDLTLDRMWRCLEAVGNPHEAVAPVIHVAGTNGKGSVQAMIRAGLVSDIEDLEVFNFYRMNGRLNVHAEYGYLVNEVTARCVLEWWRGTPAEA